MKRLSICIVALIVCLSQALSTAALAQDNTLKKEELDSSWRRSRSIPTICFQTCLWRRPIPSTWFRPRAGRRRTPSLKGDGLAESARGQGLGPEREGDSSPFPQVLDTMNDKLDWTQKLGDAFLAQQDRT